MYEYISETGGDFTPLTNLKVLQPGGAALSDSILNALVSAGVNVKTTYGSTEIGPPLRPIPHMKENPKCYSFRNLYPDNPFLKMEEVGKGVYECIVYKGFEFAAELWEGKNPDEPYRTNDLFVQDPPGSGFYTLQGRKDDILVHSNGENTSAGPLQLDIQSSSKMIHKALALGHSQPCVALLIEVSKGYDPKDEKTRNSIWEAIQQVNARYPSHSQVLQHMISFLPTGKALPLTPKGNVRRKEAESLYSSEIASLYNTTPISPQVSISHQQPLESYLRTLLSTLSNTPESDIQPHTSFYTLGIDSRLALSLRSSLSTYLQRPVSLSSIFENPSISQLVEFLTPSSTSNGIVKPTAIETTKRIIADLEAEFQSWPPAIQKKRENKGKETVLLTGASGSLGTALLQTLSASEKVEKIYAMVRGPNHVFKLAKSLESRGMDAGLLKEGGKIEVVSFSMADPLLGLDIGKYAEIASTVTWVMGNAWKMDFNVGVEGFVGDCLRSMLPLFLFSPFSSLLPVSSYE
jgi:hypothetical protein